MPPSLRGSVDALVEHREGFPLMESSENTSLTKREC
jgi:hypothetical protein